MDSLFFIKTFLKSVKSFTLNLPMLFSVILLTGLFEVFITPDMLSSLFTGSIFYDSLIGTISGGVSAGQPFVSYIIGGKLLDNGMSYYAVTAFVLSWVTLGLVQLPYEYSLFGGRFTLIRNLLAFIFVLLISFATVQTLILIS